MKKISLTLIICCVILTLHAQTFVSTTPSNKNVILEEFTGRICSNCPAGHRVAGEIANANQGRVFLINIHTGDFAPTTHPNYNTPFGAEIASKAGANFFPSGTVNRHLFSGQNTVLNGSRWLNSTNTILNESSYVNIAAQSTINSVTRELVVNVEIYYTGNSPVVTNKLNVALLQNNMLGAQTGMNGNPSQIINGKYNHQHMLRHLLTGQWGEDITPATQGTFISKQYTYTVPAHLNGIDYDLPDLEIVVFIAEGEQEIITGVKSSMNEVENIAEFIAANNNVTNPMLYHITGDLTFVFRSGANMYVQDETGGLLIYDNGNIITEKYEEGDIIHGIYGTYTLQNGISQMIPLKNTESAKNNTGEVIPLIATVAEIINDYQTYESKLVRINNVILTEDHTFTATASNVNFTQDTNEMQCYNLHRTLDMALEEGMDVDIIGFVLRDDDVFRIAPRGNEDVIIEQAVVENNKLSVNIYPVPVNNTLVIETGNFNPERIEIFSYNGQILYIHDNPRTKESVDVQYLDAGIYFVRVFSGKDIVVRKFVKQ